MDTCPLFYKLNDVYAQFYSPPPHLDMDKATVFLWYKDLQTVQHERLYLHEHIPRKGQHRQ